MMAHQTTEGRKQGGQAIDGEHPDRCDAWKLEITSAESLECSEGDFQKPAEQAAVDIVMDQFSHGCVVPFLNGYRPDLSNRMCWSGQQRKRFYKNCQQRDIIYLSGQLF